MYLNFLRKDFKNILNRTNKTKLKSPIQLFFFYLSLTLRFRIGFSEVSIIVFFIFKILFYSKYSTSQQLFT